MGLGVLAWYGIPGSGRTRLLCFVFAGAAAAAVFLNLAWCLWAIGVPIDIGAARRGQLNGRYWVGPLSMAYAAICWLFYRRACQQESGNC